MPPHEIPTDKTDRHPTWLQLLDRATSSIWVGMALVLFIFVYSSIGSAMIWVRQARLFEMTEFEWFHWWPFTVSVALMTLVMVRATLKKWPPTRRNAGMMLTHVGIVVLVLGSWYYFAFKLEGDTYVIRRAVVASAPGGAAERFPALPGAGAELSSWTLRVMDIQPEWPLLSGPDKGKTAYSVQVMVEPTGGGQPFIRQLLAGYPQYTEDVIPGQGRAVKSTGRKLVDERLDLALDLEPQEYFYLKDSAALYLRELGDTEWQMRPLSGLPRYNDYVPTSRDIWAIEGEGAPRALRSLDIEAAPGQGDDFGPLRVRGYLRYAESRQWLAEGGEELNPAVSLRLRREDGEGFPYQLLALQAGLDTAAEGQIAFRWIEDEADRAALLRDEPGSLTLRAQGGPPLTLVTTETLRDNPELGFRPIPGSDYSFRLRSVNKGLRLPNGRVVSVVEVEVRGPERHYLRWVADDPAMTRDMPLEDAGMSHQPLPEDSDLEARFEPGHTPPWITVVAGPDAGPEVRVRTLDGEVSRHPAPEGTSVDLGGGLFLDLERYMTHARFDSRPAIVPPRARDSNAGAFYSMVKVELPGVEPQWLPFNYYALPEASYSYPGRFLLRPASFTLPDGRRIEVLYSRERRTLPRPVALEDFHITAHVGGFTGDTQSIRNWTSELRFREDGGWGEPVALSVNDPVQRGVFWFFQSSWDPPSEQSGAGLNYTGLGVGNRRGVYVQLVGSIIAVLGMLYAFYGRALTRRREAPEPTPEAAPAPPPRFPALVMSLVGVLVLVAILGYGRSKSRATGGEDPSLFAQEVDLTPLGEVAVYTQGRLKSFPSFADAMLRQIAGPRAVRGQQPGFSYLDMMFRPDAYEDVARVYVKHKQMRNQIAAMLEGEPGVDRDWIERFPAVGLIPTDYLSRRPVQALLQRQAADLIRTARFVSGIRNAAALSRPMALESRLRILPQPGGDFHAPWHSPQALETAAMPHDDTHAGMAPGGIPGMDEATVEQLRGLWSGLAGAWRAADAPRVNRLLAELSDRLHALNPDLYPPAERLRWESWYFRHGNMTWVWLIYMFAAIPFLAGIVYRWRRAWWLGMTLFLVAFVLHSFAIGLRWYVSGRFPNANMFEALTTAAWFGGWAALVLELFVRRRAMRGLFALGSALASMAALMAVHFLPLHLNPAIGNRMPVLHDIWLYIHTNVIIFSYCLIGMAAVTATLYLVWRATGGGLSHARLGGIQALRGGGGRRDLGELFDGATMLLMELSFVLLWAGIVMGAIWADHSWGRPWGWDPKEVFALNTFLVFVGLIHVRLEIEDKGFWTAVLAVIGCGVMLFNWIVINFVIAGLHSYA